MKENQFETIKRIDDNGSEYWSSRDLAKELEYPDYRKFLNVIEKAKVACENSGQVINNHFVHMDEMVAIGSGAERSIETIYLSRYACYLVVQNSDPTKVVVAKGQTYFAIQTRRQEIFDKLPDAEKRLFIRGEVTNENKKLFRTAKEAGVSHFGLFNDAGYRGLYGAPLSDVEAKKGIKKGELLDRAGATELAANLFRITQTDEKLKNDSVRGDSAARNAHNMVGGKVRQTIKDIGGTLPENLKPEKHIKEIKKEMKQLEKQEKKALLSAKKPRKAKE